MRAIACLPILTLIFMDGCSGSSSNNGGPFHFCDEAREESENFPFCRQDSDCECGSCYFSWLCGGMACQQSTCASDEDCSEQDVCEPRGDSCCQYSECIPKCTVDSCGDDQRCDESGHCLYNTCEQGRECPQNTRCKTREGDTSICDRLECSNDSDCDCGTCVKERCYDYPAQCCPPQPG